MTAHLGTRVSALLDGHLAPAEEERAWAHVHECHPCRDLVEREGWVKTRLAELSLGPAAASDRLKSSLLDPAAPGAPCWSAPPTRSRQRGLVAVGGGAASAAMVGVLALAIGPGATTQLDRRVPRSDISRPSPAAQVTQAPTVARSAGPVVRATVGPTPVAARVGGSSTGGAASAPGSVVGATPPRGTLQVRPDAR